jgi:oxygen-dependent protoporphyrinogen oxidase
VPGLKSRELKASTEANKRYIVRGGKLHAVPMGPLSAITTPLWSFTGKLRVLKEPFVSRIDAEQEESAADFVRRRLGNELYEYAINPLIGGIYAGNPEALSLRYAFPKLYALEQNYGGLIRGAVAKMWAAKSKGAPKFDKRIISFKDGLHELPKLLAEALGDLVHTGISLQSIQQRDSKWAVEWDGNTHEFDEVVLTTPSHTLGKLPFCESIQDSFKPLEQIDYPPVSVLSMSYKRSDIQHPLDGFGALVPECEGHNILGVLFPSSIFKGRAPEDEVLLTVFIGGERQPELAVADTEQIKETATAELSQLLGISGQPTFCHHKHWPLAIPQYKLGYGEILKQIDNIESSYLGLKLRGNYRDGISLSYCIEAAFK